MVPIVYLDEMKSKKMNDLGFIQEKFEDSIFRKEKKMDLDGDEFE